MAPFTLAHLSDPHLPPLPKPRLIELAGKRALGYVNWTRNRHKYQRREVLDALVADMKAQGPDHIAVTGDLVNLALEAEFAPALAWLDGVGPPDRVTTIPGNHDAYVRATSLRFGETFAPYLAGDDGRIGIAPVGHLCCAFDHRALDGAYAGAFLRRVGEIVETRDWLSEL